MKLIVGDDIIIYLSKAYIKNININDKDDLIKLIKKINNKYNIELSGYLNINVYIDKNYGIIMNIKKEELEYLDYFNDIQMNIEVTDDSFLYKIDDILCIKKLLNDIVLYKYKDHFYLKIIKISDINLGKILEYCQLIYGKKARNIINKGIIIKPEVIT